MEAEGPILSLSFRPRSARAPERCSTPNRKISLRRVPRNYRGTRTDRNYIRASLVSALPIANALFINRNNTWHSLLVVRPRVSTRKSDASSFPCFCFSPAQTIRSFPSLERYAIFFSRLEGVTRTFRQRANSVNKDNHYGVTLDSIYFFVSYL